MNSVSDVHYHDMDQLRKNTGWFLALGIIMIILGALAIIVPFIATFALETLFGILFVVGGVLQIVHSFRWSKSRRFALDLLIGILYGAFGILLLAYPLGGVVTLTLILAAFFVIEGIFKIVQSFRMRPGSSWGWMLVSGIISLFLGFFIWGSMPFSAFWALGVVVGVDLIFTGWATIMISQAMRSPGRTGSTFCIGGECYTA
jgi:uncharacterized membrane protein HdeD (DUF308 family)